MIRKREAEARLPVLGRRTKGFDRPLEQIEGKRELEQGAHRDFENAFWRGMKIRRDRVPAKMKCEVLGRKCHLDMIRVERRGVA